MRRLHLSDMESEGEEEGQETEQRRLCIQKRVIELKMQIGKVQLKVLSVSDEKNFEMRREQEANVNYNRNSLLQKFTTIVNLLKIVVFRMVQEKGVVILDERKMKAAKPTNEVKTRSDKCIDRSFEIGSREVRANMT